jgi:hypothetical protein
MHVYKATLKHSVIYNATRADTCKMHLTLCGKVIVPLNCLIATLVPGGILLLYGKLLLLAATLIAPYTNPYAPSPRSSSDSYADRPLILLAVVVVVILSLVCSLT